MKLVLTKIEEDFNTFSESLYKARNALSLKDKFQTFVSCSKCHKLYEKSEVENFCQNKTPMIINVIMLSFPIRHAVNCACAKNCYLNKLNH